MATMNVSLPQSMKDFIEGQVATGQFSNASDYVRDLIRERQAAVDRLRALVEEGDASGESGLDFDGILAGIKERHKSRAG